MAKILEGLRIIEGSAFVAAPLAGMTLAQMGADVIRFDRIGGGLDHARWPVTANGQSLFWAGMNKGKRSLAIDMTKPEAKEIITRLICAPGADCGIFLTNMRSRGWLDYDELRKHREDLIMMSVTGDRRGGPQVDYTVNPSVGFPAATGAEDSTGPVGHVLPAWDCITGQQAALAILAAERHRQRTGKGQLIDLALRDVAFAMLGNLGIIAEVTINGHDRPKLGNSIYGGYAQDFRCADGRRVMVVALTLRQWDNLCTVTGSRAACEDLGKRLGVDLRREGERFKARHAITDILKPWFAARRLSDFADAFTSQSVTWSEYQTFREAVERDPDCSLDNPMFAMTEQPGIGSYLAPGLPAAFSDVERVAPARAPLLGEHTDEILTELGYGRKELDQLRAARIIASASPV